ncbi:type II toxin-antitoxin system RelE/ParE family toxin [Microcystis aeruginosa]|uniref:type II toxin-antitoxin system RelE/ParE family toxin n=1 Tax=Microcystis aeruginosa TaxID=1126 RepID=UPI00308313B5
MQGFNFPVFKVRLKNSDIKKGKSGGYRVIYYLQTQTTIVLITLYSKTDQTDITDQAIAEAISQLDF